MSLKLYTREQIKDAIWQELKKSDYAGENNDRAYEVIGIVMAGIDKIVVGGEESGPAWVKASDRLPEQTKQPRLYIVKWYDAQMFVRTWTVNQLADWVKNTPSLEYFWLDESGQSKVWDKEREIAFAEWLRTNWTPSQNGWVDVSGKWGPTQGLYELFKQQKGE